MDTEKVIIELLKNRGITEKDEVVEFLSLKPQKTYDPSLLSDMEEGVDLILKNIKDGKKICIYGDYDADGITSTTLMMSILSHLTDRSNLSYHIPSRFEEGYGLNKDTLKAIKDKGTDFVITVDCGSVSREEVAYAKEIGLEILVTDHHTITDSQADCLLINPKKPGDNYPFKELSGCGVAFKVASHLQKKANLPKAVLSEVLDLVAIGTIGDIMPLVDENRTMVKFGLKMINTNPRAGLRKLISEIGLENGNITSENVGFAIVPHLNASGRIEDASQCVRLLLSGSDSKEANDIVSDLVFKNQERRRIQQDTYKKAVEILKDEIGDGPSVDNVPGIIMLRIHNAHEGIIGIVAGKIKETYNRPSIIVTETNEEGILKGTGRSITGVNMYDLLKSHEDLFVKFGGHKGACGFSVSEQNYEKLRKELFFDMAKAVVMNPDIFKQETQYDMELDMDDVTIELAKKLELFQPFGSSNPKPVFKLTDVELEDVKLMGQEKNHVKFTAISESGRAQCVGFNQAEVIPELADSDQIDLIGKLDISTWQGTERIQFKVDKIISQKQF